MKSHSDVGIESWICWVNSLMLYHHSCLNCLLQRGIQLKPIQ